MRRLFPFDGNIAAYLVPFEHGWHLVDALEGLDAELPVTEPEPSPTEFHAEDVPDLLATKDCKGLSPMDIVTVLKKVVQELKAENEGVKGKNESLENRILIIEEKLTISK